MKPLVEVMRRFRPELLKGLTVFGIFLALIISTELLLPYPIEYARCTCIGIGEIKQNPVPFEGVMKSIVLF